MTVLILLIALGWYLGLLWFGKGFLAWTLSGGFLLLVWMFSGGIGVLNGLLALLLVTAAVIFGVKPLRTKLISAIAIKKVAAMLPSISQTEEVALKAGTVGWEQSLFAGKPDWVGLENIVMVDFTKEEEDFLNGPVNELCALLNEEDIAQNRDLSPKAWDYIKKQRFFGMIIPKEHGGLGFSATAHAAVVTRIASRSVPAAVTVMVPNSLGPAELLLHYGTDEQKKYYLPRLADGREIPCFALTEPHAGSDAANGRSYGVVVKQTVDGKEILGIKLTFNKRYITLAPIATVYGLAFRLHDPENLLGKGADIGITCALLPRSTEGLEVGNHHDPMGIPFMNGPVRGKDVFIPMDYVIGGQEYVGQGWRMLMECLSTGRGISLPSLSVGAAQLSLRACSAYSVVREQFGTPIGLFEGVAERLARIAGLGYGMEAVLLYSSTVVDKGESPAVVSGIAKAYLTEGMRTTVNDGMDIMAGAAICRGPANILSRGYTSIPIGITVEGANILTRSMIIFGQGVLRCHPFLLQETETAKSGDVQGFDAALFGHINHFYTNGGRSLLLGLTAGYIALNSGEGALKRAYQHIDRLSAGYAFLVDMGLLLLGGNLKRKEAISGRYADALAWLLVASTTLKRYKHEGSPEYAVHTVQWTLDYALYHAEQALDGIIQNLPLRAARVKARLVVLPFGPRLKMPHDRITLKVAKELLNPDAQLRNYLTRDVFVPTQKEPGLGQLELALQLVSKADAARKKLKEAVKEGVIEKGQVPQMAKQALAQSVIDEADLAALKAAEQARDAVIQVADFTPEQYKNRK